MNWDAVKAALKAKGVPVPADNSQLLGVALMNLGLLDEGTAKWVREQRVTPGKFQPKPEELPKFGEKAPLAPKTGTLDDMPTFDPSKPPPVTTEQQQMIDLYKSGATKMTDGRPIYGWLPTNPPRPILEPFDAGTPPPAGSGDIDPAKVKGAADAIASNSLKRGPYKITIPGLAADSSTGPAKTPPAASGPKPMPPGWSPPPPMEYKRSPQLTPEEFKALPIERQQDLLRGEYMVGQRYDPESDPQRGTYDASGAWVPFDYSGYAGLLKEYGRQTNYADRYGQNVANTFSQGFLKSLEEATGDEADFVRRNLTDNYIKQNQPSETGDPIANLQAEYQRQKQILDMKARPKVSRKELDSYWQKNHDAGKPQPSDYDTIVSEIVAGREAPPAMADGTIDTESILPLLHQILAAVGGGEDMPMMGEEEEDDMPSYGGDCEMEEGDSPKKGVALIISKGSKMEDDEEEDDGLPRFATGTISADAMPTFKPEKVSQPNATWLKQPPVAKAATAPLAQPPVTVNVNAAPAQPAVRPVATAPQAAQSVASQPVATTPVASATKTASSTPDETTPEADAPAPAAGPQPLTADEFQQWENAASSFASYNTTQSVKNAKTKEFLARIGVEVPDTALPYLAGVMGWMVKSAYQSGLMTSPGLKDSLLQVASQQGWGDGKPDGWNPNEGADAPGNDPGSDPAPDPTPDPEPGPDGYGDIDFSTEQAFVDSLTAWIASGKTVPAALISKVKAFFPSNTALLDAVTKAAGGLPFEYGADGEPSEDDPPSEPDTTEPPPSTDPAPEENAPANFTPTDIAYLNQLSRSQIPSWRNLARSYLSSRGVPMDGVSDDMLTANIDKAYALIRGSQGKSPVADVAKALKGEAVAPVEDAPAPEQSAAMASSSVATASSTAATPATSASPSTASSSTTPSNSNTVELGNGFVLDKTRNVIIDTATGKEYSAGGTTGGDDAPTQILYGPDAWKNNPSLKFINQLIGSSAFNQLGGMPSYDPLYKTTVDAPNALNYGDMLQALQDPTAAAILDAIFKRHNRSLTGDAIRAGQFAPLGDARYTGEIRTA